MFLLFYLAVLIFSVMIHEISHGYVAERLGDPTARAAGRLTLNPVRHIDPFGSLLLPMLLFFLQSPVILGWAKPVPYNPNNLYKDYRYGPLKVALAGPLSNIILLFVFGLLARFGGGFLNPGAVGLLGFIAYLNAFLAIFNLLPIPPLDGSKLLTLFLPPRYAFMMERMGLNAILLVLLFLFFFSGIIVFITTRLFLAVAGEAVFIQTLNVVQSLFS